MAFPLVFHADWWAWLDAFPINMLMSKRDLLVAISIYYWFHVVTLIALFCNWVKPRVGKFEEWLSAFPVIHLICMHFVNSPLNLNEMTCSFRSLSFLAVLAQYCNAPLMHYTCNWVYVVTLIHVLWSFLYMWALIIGNIMHILPEIPSCLGVQLTNFCF